MIQSFRCKHTEALHRDGVCRRNWGSLENAALSKLDMVDAAVELANLRIKPGNRLEKLSGDRRGQWGIRINDQWRVCFRWSETGPDGVEIIDYR